MNVFVAGATGAIGYPLVAQLIKERHRVFGTSRSKERGSEIAKLGATVVIANALDKESISQAIQKTKPDVVIEMLTSLPKKYTPEAMKQAAAQNSKLKLEGGKNLQEAAEKFGVKRYMIQSSAFWYELGNGLADEQTPFAFDASPNIAAGCKEYMQIEQRILNSNKLQGTVLRFGFFYGPKTWYATDGNMAEQVRAKSFYIIGEGEGVWNFVHTEDAAQGIAKALHAPAGIYNITGVDPTPLNQWLPAYARYLNAPAPLKVSVDEGLKEKGPDVVYYATKLRGASNAKARQLLNFNPRVLEWV